MNIIPQTNRTLLLDSINDEKLDLLTLIGDVKGIDSLSDDKIKEINLHLECSNYEEFERKFMPMIYSFYDANSQSVKYLTNKPENIPENMLTKIALTSNNDFLKMLFTLIDSKKSLGMLNVDFKFENLLDMISPKKVMEDIKQVRKEIRYNYEKHDALEDGDPQKLDIGDKLNVLFETASENYNNVMAMLPLAIEDIKTRLLLMGENGGNSSEPIVLGMLTLGEKGELNILEAPESEGTEIAITSSSDGGLIEIFSDDYEDINDNPNDYVKNLVVRTFCPLASTNNYKLDTDTEVENYNSYLEFYKKAKDDFIKVVKPLVEKLLGIKMFFDQYKTKTKGMVPKLLIANIKPEMLSKSGNLPTLITYLNTVNSKNNFRDTLWYAIYPNLSLSQDLSSKLKKERFKGNVKKEGTEINSLESLSILLNVLKDYRIETFFSFENREETTFNNIATEGIEQFIEKCMPLVNKAYSEFAVPCLPNFTVIPKNKSGVTLDKKMLLSSENVVKLSEEKEDIMKLWIEGVYIGAAYVAAGFRGACQCSEFLKDRFRMQKLDSELPGVRFDIEAGNNSLSAPTTMPKEITGFTNGIKNQINNKNFGFIFVSENASLDGKNISDITVYKARNLLYDPDKSTYESIYKTQVTTYIERILRYVSSDFKQDNIIEFFSNNPNSIKSKWIKKNDCINAIISEGDELDYKINDEVGICELAISFGGNTRNLEILVNRLSSE